MNRAEIYNQISEKIITKIKEGVLPWRKSWKHGLPMNFISKRPYTGINFLSLLMNDFASPYYLSFLQCREKNGLINACENGNLVIYWSIKEYPLKDEEPKTVPIIKYSYVFNLAQTNLFRENDSSHDIMECEELISKLSVKPTIKNNISRSYYSPAEDYISLPMINDFDSPDEYYSTLFHELIHWTAHPSRLDRKEEYAFEELIAEMGSAYICGLCGLTVKTFDNQVSYIHGWLNKLDSNPSYIIQASQKAQKAVEFLSII
jgi:antirestriction protein ArdC